MTVLEKFITFAKALPSNERESIDEVLASLMRSHGAEFDFSPPELSELDRRLADPHPEFADPEEITRLFGKPFSA